MTYCPPRSTILQNFSTIVQMVFEICVTKFFYFLAQGANPWAKVHQRRDDLLDTQVYQPTKFHHPPSTQAGDIPYQIPADIHTKKTNKQTVNDISPACLWHVGIIIITKAGLKQSTKYITYYTTVKLLKCCIYLCYVQIKASYLLTYLLTRLIN